MTNKGGLDRGRFYCYGSVLMASSEVCSFQHRRQIHVLAFQQSLAARRNACRSDRNCDEAHSVRAGTRWDIQDQGQCPDLQRAASNGRSDPAGVLLHQLPIAGWCPVAESRTLQNSGECFSGGSSSACLPRYVRHQARRACCSAQHHVGKRDSRASTPWWQPDIGGASMSLVNILIVLFVPGLIATLFGAVGLLIYLDENVHGGISRVILNGILEFLELFPDYTASESSPAVFVYAQFQVV